MSRINSKQLKVFLFFVMIVSGLAFFTGCQTANRNQTRLEPPEKLTLAQKDALLEPGPGSADGILLMQAALSYRRVAG